MFRRASEVLFQTKLSSRSSLFNISPTKYFPTEKKIEKIVDLLINYSTLFWRDLHVVLLYCIIYIAINWIAVSAEFTLKRHWSWSVDDEISFMRSKNYKTSRIRKTSRHFYWSLLVQISWVYDFPVLIT